MKHQRTIDESKLKVLKWNFTTPREEFVALLKDQMLAANVNKNLIGNMFHTDFGYHIKALEALMDDLNDNGPALIANLDLILKWLTLRFFDTNPSVVFKGLEYLHSVFNMLSETNYKMLESEASSFLPYLVMKVIIFMKNMNFITFFYRSEMQSFVMECALFSNKFVLCILSDVFLLM